MSDLYGVDCSYTDCRHDSVTSYRLRLMVRRNKLCMICAREGQPQPERVNAKGMVQADWYRCPVCCVGNRPVEWRIGWENEMPDRIFRPNQLESALSQMVTLGAKDDVQPDTGRVVTDHPTLPPGYEARLMILRKEPMPKTAIYFRWNPERGEMLTPDKVFQFNFTPDMPAEERCTKAMARNLTEEECRVIVQACGTDGRMRESFSVIRCQHCHRPLPLSAFSRQGLREVLRGD